MANRRSKAARVSGGKPLPEASSALLVMPDGPARDALLGRLELLGLRVSAVGGHDDASRLLEESNVDSVLVCDSAPGAGVLITQISGTSGGPTCVLMCAKPSLALALEAMRAGASDILTPDLDDAHLGELLSGVISRGRAARAGMARIEARARRYRELCRRLRASRAEVMSRSGELCGEMAQTCRDLTRRLADVALASEVTTLLRQELELESLLRTALEYMLKKTGPTNAAIFLPSTSGDFSLGAYANYDCPKDSAETMLDHLSGVIAPAFEAASEPALLSTWPQLNLALGADAHLLEEYALSIFPCRHEGECLGVACFFRDRRTSFDESTMQTLGRVTELFGSQLARVIRTHHRHLPKDKWGSPGDPTGGLDEAA